MREVIPAEHHIECRSDDRLSGSRLQEVLRGKHDFSTFLSGLVGQRHMHGHLVSVEVRIESGAYHRVQTDRLSLDQYRLKSLNGKSVQSRCAVKQDIVVLDDLIEDFVCFLGIGIHHAAGGSDIVREFLLDQFLNNKRFEQFERHFLRQSALMEFQFRTDDDDGTSRIIHTLSKEVLTETTLFPLERIREGTEGATLSGRGGSRSLTTTGAVIKERIHCLLQHSFFIPGDHFWRTDREQFSQAIIPVDDTAIEIIQIGSRETSAIKRHHRAEIRRDHRNHGREHPFQFQFGLLKTLKHFQPLQCFFAIQTFADFREFTFQLFDLLADIYFLENLANGFGTDTGGKHLPEPGREIKIRHFGKDLMREKAFQIILGIAILFLQFFQCLLKLLRILILLPEFLLL